MRARGRRTCAEQFLSRLLGFCARILRGFSSVTSGIRCCSRERDEGRSVEGCHHAQGELSSRGRAAAGSRGREGEREKSEERGRARAGSRAGSSVRHQISDPRSRKKVEGCLTWRCKPAALPSSFPADCRTVSALQKRSLAARVTDVKRDPREPALLLPPAVLLLLRLIDTQALPA
jgi:hypothetical protein